MNLASFPEPDVLDCAERLNCSQGDAEFLLDFAPDCLLGAFIWFETAAGRAVIDEAGVRVSHLGDEECVIAAKDAEGGLADLDLHGVLI